MTNASSRPALDLAARVHRWVSMLAVDRDDKLVDYTIDALTVEQVAELLYLTDLPFLLEDTESIGLLWHAHRVNEERGYIELVDAGPLWQERGDVDAWIGRMAESIAEVKKHTSGMSPIHARYAAKLILRRIVAYFGGLYLDRREEVATGKGRPDTTGAVEMPAFGLYRRRTPREVDEMEELAGMLQDCDDPACDDQEDMA